MFIDGALAWISRGPALEVFMAASGARRAAWCFGSAIKETGVNVSAVAEYPVTSPSSLTSSSTSTYLLVGTTVPNSESGMLCLFDVKASKVIKAIDFPYMVSQLL